MALRIVRPHLQSVADAFLRRQLKHVVVAVGSGSELCHGGEAGVGRRAVREWAEATGANRLVSVNLGRVGLVYRACADVLSAQTPGVPELPLDGKTPLQEIGRAQLTVGNGGESDRWKTRRRVGRCGSARGCAPLKSIEKRLIGGDGRIDGAVRHARCNRQSARLPHKAALDRKSTRLNSSHLGISYAV